MKRLKVASDVFSVAMHGAILTSLLFVNPSVLHSPPTDVVILSAPQQKISSPPPAKSLKASSHQKVSHNQIADFKPKGTEDLSSQHPSPSQTLPTSAEGPLARYMASIHHQIEERKEYPRKARIKNQEGPVEVAFRVLKDGTIEQVRVTKAAPFEALNEAAIDAVNRVRRVAALPPEIGGETLDITLVLLFKLN